MKRICKSEVRRALKVAFEAEPFTFKQLFDGIELPFWYDGLRYVLPFKLEQRGCFCDVDDMLLNKAINIIKEVNRVNK